jgi:F-type H+-transporting ATPase subunit b
LAAREKTVRNEALRATMEMESEGQHHASEIIKGVRQEMESLRSKTQQTVSEQLAAARQRREQESESLALNIMEKLLERRLTR